MRALSDRWPDPEKAYREGAKELGTVTLSRPEPDIFVANLVCQRGIDDDRCLSPLALEQCLQKVVAVAAAMPAKLAMTPTFHCPRIGTGRGRTPWASVERILQCALSGHIVYVYDLPEGEHASWR